jgi:hypothetical protein
MLVITSLCIYCQVQAQNPINLEQEKKSSFKDHLFFGGGLGLQFGNMTLIDISPMVGYKITPRIGIGVGPTYKYYGYKDKLNPSYDFKTNVYGGSIFSRIILYENIFAHAEYESLYYKMKNSTSSGLPESLSIQSVLVGGGYRQQIGENAFMNLMILWNLNETPDSPYTNPIIRAGFSVGL